MTRKSLSAMAGFALVAGLGLGVALAGCGVGITEPGFIGDTLEGPGDEDPQNTTWLPAGELDLAGLILEADATIG